MFQLLSNHVTGPADGTLTKTGPEWNCFVQLLLLVIVEYKSLFKVYKKSLKLSKLSNKNRLSHIPIAYDVTNRETFNALP